MLCECVNVSRSPTLLQEAITRRQHDKILWRLKEEKKCLWITHLPNVFINLSFLSMINLQNIEWMLFCFLHKNKVETITKTNSAQTNWNRCCYWGFFLYHFLSTWTDRIVYFLKLSLNNLTRFLKKKNLISICDDGNDESFSFLL